ncbi:hypothetical protein KJA13_03895 [Patescibacteria group bacterium]|nr:hypothetical protein [Patescibacteria group bacterium]
MAWLADAFIGVITVLPGLMVMVFVFVFAGVSSLFARLCGALLKWVTSPLFIKMPYTKPGSIPDGNPIIEAGLSITQGFVNMLLVLILVYIAIATILRLAGYETRRLLVTFILVALLVNFAPVVCGLVVDASNIIMNFFLGEVSGGRHLIANLNNLWEIIKEELVGLKAFSTAFIFTERLEVIFKVAAIGVINLYLGLILLLFACIFVFRYIAIWMLVILSPLAFACYILPVTRKYWTMWWNQLIQWSFIGVTCAFFLYLADLLANLGTQIYGSSAPMIVGDRILPYLVPIGFLMMALIFGLKTSAMGASTVMSLSKRSGKWVGKATWKGLRPNIDRALYRATEKIRGKGKGITTRTIGAGIAKQWGKAPVARWFLPESLRKYGQYRPALLAAAKEAESYDSRTLMDRVYTLADKEEQAAGGAYSVLDRVDAQDVFDAGKRAFGKAFKRKYGRDMSDDELIQNKKFREITGRFLHIARQSGMLGGGFTRKDPRLAIIAAMEGIKGYGDIKDTAGNPLKGEDLIRAAVRKAVGEARQHIAKWEPEILKNKYVMEAMLGQFDRDRWLQVNRQVKRGQDSALNGIDSTFSDFIEKDPGFKDLSAEQIQGKLKDLTPGEIKAKVKLKIETELKEEDLKPKEREKELKIRLEKRLPEALQDPRSAESKAAWKKFTEDIKKLNLGLEGYVKALKDKRIQQTGWRAGGYIPKSERWQGKVGVLTPGKAMMGPSPPEEERKEGYTGGMGPTQ